MQNGWVGLFKRGRSSARGSMQLILCMALFSLFSATAGAEPVEISLNQEVSGEIVPGEELVYEIRALSPGQRVYLQRTEGTGISQLAWTLEDRFGRVIVQDPIRINDLGPVALMGGDYLLAVRGKTPTSAGTFGFVLHSVDDTASTLSVEAIDVRSLPGVGAMHSFDLPVSDPGPFRLFFGEASTSELSYRLTDALGNLRQDWTSSAPLATGPLHLPVGTHRIDVRGRGGYAGDFSLQVRRESEPAVVPLTLNGSADYESDDVSETTAFSFQISDMTRAFIEFDFQHSFVAGQWRLERDDGDVIGDWSSNMGISLNPVDLLAGAYTLSIRSRSTVPVSGTVLLHEVLDTESGLLPDEPVTAEILVPGQEHRFHISGLPAGSYLLDELGTDSIVGLGWRIEDSLGRPVLEQTTNVRDVEGIALKGGDYTLTVGGNGAATTGYVDLSLTTVEVIVLPANLGEVIDDAIIQPGEIRRYGFTSPPGRILSIERQASSNSSGLNYILEDAVGRPIVERTSSLPNSIERRLAGGDYFLTVLGEGGATGSFTLALNDDGPAGFAPSGTPVLLDDLTESTIGSGASEQWLIQLTEPGRVYFDLVAGASGLTWMLFDSAGQPMFDNDRALLPANDDHGPFLLAAGDYTVEFGLTGGGTADYAFRAVEAPVTETPIDLDEPIDSVPTVVGFRNDYLFTVPVDGRFHFELLEGDFALRWRLEHASGEIVFGTSTAGLGSQSRGPFDLAAGDYRLIFDAIPNAAPVYRFQIHGVSDLEAVLSLGSAPVPIDGTMAMPGQQHEYAVTIESGVDRLYIQALSGDTALRYELFDAAGRSLAESRLAFTTNDDRGPLVVKPGEYRLVIRMTAPTDSDYSLTLHAPQSSASQATALDQLETWIPPGPGAEQRYALSLGAGPNNAFFDPQISAPNVYATLTHLPSGWQPFADVDLNVAFNATRGPFSLPQGEYAFVLRALPTTAEPSWQLAGVDDEHAGPIGINEVVAAEISTPGSRLSYTVEPEEDGQALIFDLMSGGGYNLWVLHDPVGTVVFGPANAGNYNSNDQGPIPLAAGVYTLAFSNSRNEAQDWLFRVASSGSTIEVPEGCAACSSLDMVFAFDTSGSMSPVSQSMCDLARDLVDVLADDGIPVSANYWGLVNSNGGSCLSSSVLDEMGPEVPNSPPPWMEFLDVCPSGSLTTENWAPATAILANRYPWADDAVRLVIPVADDGPFCGQPFDDRDIESVYHARDVAIGNDVVISPLLPEQAADPVRAMAGLMTVGTGGIVTVADFGVEDILPRARSIAVAACGTQQAVAVPKFTDISPLPGTLLPSGVPLVLSGRVVPVNQFRPVLEIEVNGQASSVLDGAGAFFAVIELQPGPNRVTISAVEACGPTVLEIELMGAGDEADPWTGFAEVSELLRGQFSGTTFDRSGQRLLVDVAVDNPGAALKGPIMMAVGVDLHPGVNLLNSDGLTPNGEPYVILVPDGETLSAGGQSAIRELAFSNPGLESVDFQPRFLAPANQAPHFTSIPVTRATVGRPWTYAASAEDGNGDSVTYALLVAPSGMSAAGGELEWTPSAAGTFDVVVRASDGRGGVGRQSFSIRVVEAGFNAPPIFTSAPVIQVPIGATYSYHAAVTDPDGDAVGLDLLGAPAGMTVDPASGLVSWSNAQPGQHSVTLQADDGQGGQATQSFTLFVGEPATTQPGPAFSSTPVTYAAVDTQYRYRYLFNVAQSPQPTVTLTQGPPEMILDPVAQALEWLPGPADLGSHLVELVATDGAGQQSSQRFFLNVLESMPNQSPYIISTPPQSTVIGQTWDYPAAAVDPEFEDLTFSLTQAPPDMAIDADSGEATWNPPVGTPGSVQVSLVVSDPQGLSATQEFDIAVRAENSAPVLTSTPPAAVLLGQTYNHLFIAEDGDGDPLAFTLTDGPTGATLDPEAGWLSWSTIGVLPGSYGFEVQVSDGWGGVDALAFTMAVIEDTEAPQVEIVIERQPACATEPVTVCARASDNIGLASRSLEIDGQPRDLVAGCSEWTPPAPGTVPSQATAIDVAGLSTSVTRQLQVADCNDEQRPVVSLVSPQQEDLLVGLTPLVVRIEDDTPEALSWTALIRAGEDGEDVVLAEGTGQIDGDTIAMIDPTRLVEGTYWISVVASDGQQAGGIEFRINVGSGFKPGRLVFASSDATLPVAGVPLAFGRSYDSLDATVHGAASRQDFGPGWRLTLSGSVSDSAREPSDPDNPLALLLAEPFSDDTRVHVVKPNGERVGFTFAPKPRSFPSAFQFDVAFEPDPGVTDTLRVAEGTNVVWALGAGYADYIIPYNPSVYELETEDRLIYVISESEGLVEIRDALGGVLTLDENGVESSRGLSVDYIRDDQGRIVEIVLPPAEPGAERGRVGYGYDMIGNLITVTDLAGGVTTFEYDDPEFPHHVTAMFDPLGNPMSRLVYDDDGRLVAECPADGDPSTLDGCIEYQFDVAGGVEVIFDTRGFRSELFYDSGGRLSARKDWLDETEWVEQTWLYDEAGRLTESVDPEGGRTVRVFDDEDRELSRTYPGGQTITWTYGDCGRDWTTLTDALGNVIQREFDADCRLRFETDPLGGVTEFQYTEDGLRTAVIDPLGQTWSFSYNAMGLQSSMTDPLGAVETRVYDDLGLEVRRVDRTGQVREFEYDDAGRVLTETLVGSGLSHSWEYNVRGLATRESGPDATFDVEYLPTGRIRRMDFSGPDAPSWWVTYEYDGNGNVIDVSDSLGGRVTYEYDGLDRMTAANHSGPGVNPKRVVLDLNGNGLVERIHRFGTLDETVPGPVTDVEYACPSCASQTTGIVHRRPDDSVIHAMTFVRNANGETVALSDAQGLHEFVYDGRGWLVQADQPPLPGFASGATLYDATGNWLSRPGHAGPVTLSYATGAGGHRLLDDGGSVYSYNAVGSLLSRTESVSGATLHISYDALDRPSVVTVSDDQGVVQSEAGYRYTPSSARVFAQVDGQRRHFVLDGENVIAALDDDGEVVWRRFHTRSVDRTMAEESGGSTRWLLSDHNGSVRHQVDSTGQILAEFAYQPFGLQVLGPQPVLDDALRFTGREFDVPGGLAYYRARLYDPAGARFLSEDPIEPWHYRYAENNPLRYSDPSGKVAALEYALQLCDIAALISSSNAAGAVFQEAMEQVADGFSGQPGNPDEILEKMKDFAVGFLSPCGLPAPL